MSAADIIAALACGGGRCPCAGAARRGSGLTHCAAHVDRSPSLNVSIAAGRTLVYCHHGCSQEAVIAALRERGLWNGDRPISLARAGRAVAATYPYTDEQGGLLFEVVRYAPKGFSQRRPDGTGGWIWNVEGTRDVLYDFASVLGAAKAGARIYKTAGEKDADAIKTLGLCATTNRGGEGKFGAHHADQLAGAEVVIVVDKDPTGRATAPQDAALCRGKATSVKLLELPGERQGCPRLDQRGRRAGRARAARRPSTRVGGCGTGGRRARARGGRSGSE